jgi:hypothetical protein
MLKAMETAPSMIRPDLSLGASPGEIEALAARFPRPVTIRLRMDLKLTRLVPFIFALFPIFGLFGFLVIGKAISTQNVVVIASTTAALLMFGALSTRAWVSRWRSPPYLSLDRDGFALLDGFGGRKSYRWNEVEDFRVKGVLAALPNVRFRSSAAARSNRRFWQYREGLPPLPFRRNAAIANLMNEWRERALLGSPVPQSGALGREPR